MRTGKEAGQGNPIVHQWIEAGGYPNVWHTQCDSRRAYLGGSILWADEAPVKKNGESVSFTRLCTTCDFPRSAFALELTKAEWRGEA